jgi:hypothetical protein
VNTLPVLEQPEQPAEELLELLVFAFQLVELACLPLELGSLRNKPFLNRLDALPNFSSAIGEFAVGSREPVVDLADLCPEFFDFDHFLFSTCGMPLISPCDPMVSR